MKHLRILPALVAAILALAVASCSKNSDVLDTIPADASMVARVDVDDLLEAFDVTLAGDTIRSLPPSFTAAFGDRWDRYIPMLNQLLKSIDEDEVFVFDADKSNYIVTAEIDDEATLEAILKEHAVQTESIGGFEVYDFYETAVMTRGSQLWITQQHAGNAAVEMVKTQLERAGKRSISKLDYAVKALDDDALYNILYTTREICGVSDAFYNIKISTRDNTLRIVSEPVGTSAAVDSLRAFYPAKAIGSRLPVVAPANATLVASAGISGDFDWDNIIEKVTGGMTFAQAAALHSAAPVLKAVDGTITLNVVIDPNVSLYTDRVPGMNISLEAMIKEGKMDYVSGYFNSLLGNMIPGRRAGNATVYDAGIFKMSIAEDGNILKVNAITAGAPEIGDTENYTARFEKLDGVIKVNIPSLAPMTRGQMTFGVDAVGDMTFDKSTLTVTLTGVNGKFFPTILTALQ
ncbi:MAG: hypothetical protein J1E63_07170 [Muribaculaceae bacterium]|nr:hypothetical protein [Muribaculaceae bacterium]